MSGKAPKHWIERYRLEKHPFMNGYFKESFVDELIVSHPRHNEARSASSLIYYLHLPEGPLSSETQFYQSQSSVVTHFYTGDSVTIYTIDLDAKRVEKVLLGPEDNWHFAVPPGKWFSRFMDCAKDDSKPLDEEMQPYALVGVSLAPAFHVNDLKTEKYSNLMQ